MQNAHEGHDNCTLLCPETLLAILDERVRSRKLHYRELGAPDVVVFVYFLLLKPARINAGFPWKFASIRNESGKSRNPVTATSAISTLQAKRKLDRAVRLPALNANAVISCMETGHAAGARKQRAPAGTSAALLVRSGLLSI